MALAARAQSKVAHKVIFINITEVNLETAKAFFVNYATVDSVVVKVEYFISAIEFDSKKAPFDSKEAMHVFAQFFAVASRMFI